MAVIAFPNPTTVSGQCPTYPDAAQAVTPSDTDTFAMPVGIQVGGAGTVKVTPANGNPDVTVTCIAGQVLPFRVIAVKATGTSATGLTAFY